MSFNYIPFDVTVGFSNEGNVYGEETYRIMAENEDQAQRKAFTNASGSMYDDDRIPDRRIYIISCEEAPEEMEDDELNTEAA